MQKNRLDLLSTLLTIEKLLRKSKVKEVDLSNGDAGISIFYYYLYEITGKKSFLDKCRILLVNSINEIPNLNQYSLEKGYFGIAWAASMLASKKVIKLTEKNFFSKVDPILYITSLRCIMQGEFSFWNGGSGAVIHALTRLNNDRAIGYLAQFTEIIESYSIPTYYADKLLLKPDKKKIISDFLIKVLNDLITIVKIIIKIHSKKVFPQKPEPSILEFIDLIISYFKETDKAFSKTNDNQPHNLLFGRLQLALALFEAEKSFSIPQIRSKATELICSAIQFESKFDLDGVSLNGGTAGLSYLYKRIYICTKEAQYLDKHRYWISETLREIDATHFVKPGFLNGLAGVGLVLISSLAPDSVDNWDECFVING